MNPGADPACPAGGLFFWLTRQGGGVLGDEITETEGKITALDGVNVRHEEVTLATRVKLAVVVGTQNMAMETGKLAFASHSLFGTQFLMVEATLPLVDWIDENRSEWGRIMEDTEATTRFAYDVSWLVGRYLNACILVSLATRQEDPGAQTPCLFQVHHCRTRPRVVHRTPATCVPPSLLSVRAQRRALAAPLTLPPSPQIRYEPEDNGNESQGGRGALVAPRGHRRDECSGEAITNLRPIERLRLLLGENTWGVCAGR